MFTVILVLWCSAAAGYALHRYSVPQIGRLITWSVWLLLFLMGKEVGENPVLVQHIGRIGTEALVLALTTCAGCATLSAMVWKRLRRRRDASAQTGATDSGKKQTQTVSIRSQLAESGVIVAFFAIGCVSGRHNWLTLIPPQSSFYALCLLLVCVGFSIGQNRESSPAHGPEHCSRPACSPVTVRPTGWRPAPVSAIIRCRAFSSPNCAALNWARSH